MIDIGILDVEQYGNKRVWCILMRANSSRGPIWYYLVRMWDGFYRIVPSQVR